MLYVLSTCSLPYMCCALKNAIGTHKTPDLSETFICVLVSPALKSPTQLVKLFQLGPASGIREVLLWGSYHSWPFGPRTVQVAHAVGHLHGGRAALEWVTCVGRFCLSIATLKLIIVFWRFAQLVSQHGHPPTMAWKSLKRRCGRTSWTSWTKTYEFI